MHAEPGAVAAAGAGAAAGGWLGRLEIDYRHDGSRTLARDRHSGPYRVLRSLYPEGPGICHHVVVHPPGGVVGGDLLELEARLGPHTHAVLTTPGATRFYRSAGPTARQQVRLDVGTGARAEWLPLEAIAHPGCRAENDVAFRLAAGAQCLGWDVLALGLPASGEAFTHGRFRQTLQWPGRWLEQGVLDAQDRVLLDGPLGLAAHRVLGTAWFASAEPWPAPLRQALLDAARAALPPGLAAGATAVQPGLVLLRVLADRVEPAMALLSAVRAAWRQAAWGLAGEPLRIWRT